MGLHENERETGEGEGKKRGVNDLEEDGSVIDDSVGIVRKALIKQSLARSKLVLWR